MKKWLLTIVILLYALPSMAATYYVDFIGGADTNNGTSTSTPWKHSPGDANATDNPNSTTLAAGDVVVFKKGVTYLGRINQSADLGTGGTLVVNKSTGDASITSGGVLTSAGGNFVVNGVVAGDYIYIYHSKASLTSTWVESCGLWSIASRDSATQLTLTGFDGLAHSTAEMTYRIVRPITFKSLSSWGTGDATISGANSRVDAFNHTASCIRYEDLRIYNTTNGGIYSTGTDNHIVDCKFELMDTNDATAINVQDYFVIHGCTFTDIYYACSDGSSLSSIFEENTVEANNNGVRSIYTTRSYTIIRYNTINHVAAIYGGYHGGAIGPVDEGPSSTQWVWIYGNTIHNCEQGVMLYGNSPYPRNVVVHSNVIEGNYEDVDGVGCCDASMNNKQSGTNYFFNNTIFGRTGVPWANGFYISESPASTVVFKNNIIYHPTDYASAPMIKVDDPSDADTRHTFDYNHYYTPKSDPFEWAAGNQITYTAWKALHNADSSHFETNSYANITTLPGFTDVSTGDVTLTSSSSCKDVGTNLSAYFTLDRAKNVRGQGAGWDIGAYEYEAGATAPTSAKGLSIKGGTLK